MEVLMTTQTNIGELITLFYDEYLALYGDPDVASVAAAATINDLLSEDCYVEEEPLANAA
ncbi:MAG: hypothetical protein ACJATT_002332 [Myxococcota bacterium]|jgi:hypothetical protein